MTMDDMTPSADPAHDLPAALVDDLDAAFERLVVAHQDRLYTIALRLLADPRDAEEVAQDALVRAYRAIAGYPPDRIRSLALRGWLASIVVNLARNRYHRRPAATAALADDRSDTDAMTLPDAASAVAESGRAWARLLARLPERYRVPVVLRHVDGLSFREMADALGRPEGTLKAQVHRGLALLRTAYLASQATPEELSA
jgi:RNA polymerase sigma-70 factor (ECF subfamily)